MAAKVHIEYSNHAKERLKERRITRQQVTECLFEGTLIGFDLRGRKMNQKKISKQALIVIFVDSDGGGKVVVTAYWKGIFP